MYGDMLFKRYMKFLCKVRTGRGWGFVLLTRTVWINYMDSDSDYGFIVDVRMYRCRLMDVDSIDILFLSACLMQDSSIFLDRVPCYSCSSRTDASTTEADDGHQDLDFSSKPMAKSKVAKKSKSKADKQTNDPDQMKHCLTPVGY